jgi:(E)-4-hydroxy-3-methylbut-2-enyl-diphosphate synthase
MDSVVAEVENRLEAYEEPIEVAVLGCAVNGIGEAKHADFGIAGAKDEGVVFAHGRALKKVPTARLVDTLFEQIDLSLARGGEVEFDETESAEGEAWVQKIEMENEGDLTPEKIARMEKEAAEKGESDRVLLDEEQSPTAGRRFTRT